MFTLNLIGTLTSSNYNTVHNNNNKHQITFANICVSTKNILFGISYSQNRDVMLNFYGTITEQGIRRGMFLACKADQVMRLICRGILLQNH